MAKAPQKRIPLLAGVMARGYGLMQGLNAQPKRNPDGSIADTQPGDVGAFAQAPEAFPQQDQAFPDGGDS